MKYLALAALLVLGACATTSFNTSLYDAAQLNDAAVKTIGSLVQSHAITSAEATSALNVTNAVQAALTLAEAAYQAGNQTSAQATLTSVTTTLTALTACLASPNVNTTTACISGVQAP